MWVTNFFGVKRGLRLVNVFRCGKVPPPPPHWVPGCVGARPAQRVEPHPAGRGILCPGAERLHLSS